MGVMSGIIIELLFGRFPGQLHLFYATHGAMPVNLSLGQPDRTQRTREPELEKRIFSGLSRVFLWSSGALCSIFFLSLQALPMGSRSVLVHKRGTRLHESR
jgi:hypothetical protein